MTAAQTLIRRWTELEAMLSHPLRRGATLDVHVSPGSVRIDAHGIDPWETPSTLDALDEAAWRRIVAAATGREVRVRLAPPDVHILSLLVPRKQGSRGTAIAEALADQAPLDPDRLRWAVRWGAAGEASVAARVAIAHADHVRSIIGAFEAHGITPAIIADIDGRPATLVAGKRAGRSPLVTMLVALLLLATIPLSTAVGAHVLAAAIDRANAGIAAEGDPRLAAEARAAEMARARPVIGRLLEQRPISEIVARLAAVLPTGARIHTLSRDADGNVTVAVDLIDPDALRPALARDPLLATFRQIAQGKADTNGVRLSLRSSRL